VLRYFDDCLARLRRLAFWILCHRCRCAFTFVCTWVFLMCCWEPDLSALFAAGLIIFWIIFWILDAQTWPWAFVGLHSRLVERTAIMFFITLKHIYCAHFISSSFVHCASGKVADCRLIRLKIAGKSVSSTTSFVFSFLHLIIYFNHKTKLWNSEKVAEDALWLGLDEIIHSFFRVELGSLLHRKNENFA
jgi:hypothetical protein